MAPSRKKIKVSEKGSNRNFQACWTHQYGVVDKNGKALCVLCNGQVVSRTWNVKRHFETNHQFLVKENEEERKRFIELQLSKKNLQFGSSHRALSGPSHLVTAGFSISRSLVKHAKPFSDGEFVKDAFMNCAPFLFEDFKNKDAIIKRIEDLPITRSIVHDQVLAMHSSLQNQMKKDLDSCDFFSVCLDKITDATSFTRLAVFTRYFKHHSIYEELLKLETLSVNTDDDVCGIVVKIFRDRNIDVSKIVSVTTDGSPSMVDHGVGFVKKFTEVVGHPIVSFHCIIDQKVLCAKVGLKELDNVVRTVAKVVNVIAAQPLHKREFEPLLKEIESVYNGLLMLNDVRWLRRGRVLERFVECLNEIKLVLKIQNIEDFPELNDNVWLSRLMFFTDLSNHLSEFNAKLQGYGKVIDVMFDFIKAFESKLGIFQRDLESKSFKYFPRLRMKFKKFSEDPDRMKNELEFFLEILISIKRQFLLRFSEFRELEETISFIKYPDQADFTRLKVEAFEWLDLNDLEMELVEFQSSFIWRQKFIHLRSDLESRERDRLNGCGNSTFNQDGELLQAWNSIPETFGSLKRLAKAILTIFSSTHICETLILSLNDVKMNKRINFTDDVSSACVALKCSQYEPSMRELGTSPGPEKL